jgi:hypothetical protein
MARSTARSIVGDVNLDPGISLWTVVPQRAPAAAVRESTGERRHAGHLPRRPKGGAFDQTYVQLFVDILRPCRWPVSWLNHLLVFVARYSPLVQSAKKNQQNWERGFYGTQQGAPPRTDGAGAARPPT